MDEPLKSLPYRARRGSLAFKEHWSGDTLDPEYVRQLLEQGESPGGPFHFYSPDHEKGGNACVIVANAADPRERLDYLEQALAKILHVGTSNYIYYREIIDAILCECSDDDLRAMDHLWAMTMFNCDLPFHQEELRYLLFHPRVFESIDPDMPLLDPRYYGGQTLREALKWHYSTHVFESFITAQDQANEAQRARARLDLYREELMRVTWHPERLVAWCFPDFYE